MNARKNFLFNWGKKILKVGLIAVLLIPLSIGLSGAWWDGGGGSGFSSSASGRKSQLAQGNAITDPKALLRYALPIDSDEIRQVQASLEDISNHLRGKRWSPVSQDLKTASSVLSLRKDKLLGAVPENRKAQGEALVAQIESGIEDLQVAVDAKDKEQVRSQRQALLEIVGELEQLMVTGFPFDVPAEYAKLPQLKGRATVEVTTNKGKLTVIADGYSAPVNAGNFVDLVKRGFYDGLEFLPSQDYVLQVGDPPGKEEGFIDPKTKEYRAIPLEVLVRGDQEPIYGTTLEDAGLYLAPLALPFSAYGTVALARPGSDPNGGSSQIFFFLFDTELTPPGFNLLDGRYSVLGYVVDGKDVLEQLGVGDKVISAKVVAGGENLI